MYATQYDNRRCRATYALTADLSGSTAPERALPNAQGSRCRAGAALAFQSGKPLATVRTSARDAATGGADRRKPRPEDGSAHPPVRLVVETDRPDSAGPKRDIAGPQRGHALLTRASRRDAA